MRRCFRAVERLSSITTSERRGDLLRSTPFIGATDAAGVAQVKQHEWPPRPRGRRANTQLTVGDDERSIATTTLGKGQPRAR